jgi:hypothetical protein
MRQRSAAAACAIVTLFITLLSGAHARRADPIYPAPLLDTAESGDQDSALPPGFAGTVDRATRDQFVRLVAGDVDRDGDLDVVASLGSLDLIVWTNDGAGHFTRVASSPHPALQKQPPAPSVDGESLASNEWIQSAQPRGADVASLRAHGVDDPERPFAPTGGDAAARSDPRVRSSRAPPIPRAL